MSDTVYIDGKRMWESLERNVDEPTFVIPYFLMSILLSIGVSSLIGNIFGGYIGWPLLCILAAIFFGGYIFIFLVVDGRNKGY